MDRVASYIWNSFDLSALLLCLKANYVKNSTTTDYSKIDGPRFVALLIVWIEAKELIACNSATGRADYFPDL